MPHLERWPAGRRQPQRRLQVLHGALHGPRAGALAAVHKHVRAAGAGDCHLRSGYLRQRLCCCQVSDQL